MVVKHWLVLALLALIWGSSFLFVKIGVGELAPITVVVGRLAMGLILLFTVLFIRGQQLPRRELWKPLVIVGVINNAIPWFLIAWGEQYITSSLAAILVATTPLFSVLIASTWGDEQFSTSKFCGLVLGFLGVLIVVGVDLGTLIRANYELLLGRFAVLGAALCYAIGAVFARRKMRGESPVQLATGQLLVAFLVTLPLAMFPGNRPAVMPSLQAILAVVLLGLLGSGLAYVLYFFLIEGVGATRTVIVTYLLPIVAIFLGWALLAEVIRWQTVAGMALILGGIGLVNRVQRKRLETVQPVGVSKR